MNLHASLIGLAITAPIMFVVLFLRHLVISKRRKIEERAAMQKSAVRWQEKQQEGI